MLDQVFGIKRYLKERNRSPEVLKATFFAFCRSSGAFAV
jgi:hypothetical protein